MPRQGRTSRQARRADSYDGMQAPVIGGNYQGLYNVDSTSGKVVDERNPNWLQRTLGGGNRALRDMQSDVNMSRYSSELQTQKAKELEDHRHKLALEKMLYDDAVSRGVTPTPKMVEAIKNAVDAKSPEFAKMVISNMQGGLNLTESIQRSQKSEADLQANISNTRNAVLSSPAGSAALQRGTIAGFETPYTQQQGMIADRQNTQARTGMIPAQQEAIITGTAGEKLAQDQKAKLFPSVLSQEQERARILGDTPVTYSPGINKMPGGGMINVIQPPVTTPGASFTDPKTGETFSSPSTVVSPGRNDQMKQMFERAPIASQSSTRPVISPGGSTVVQPPIIQQSNVPPAFPMTPELIEEAKRRRLLELQGIAY